MSMDLQLKTYWNDLARMALCKFFILCAIKDDPGHGYEIIQRVNKLSKGLLTPSESTIYPVLNEFERKGCAVSKKITVDGRERRVYELTKKGREGLKVACELWREVMPVVSDAME